MYIPQSHQQKDNMPLGFKRLNLYDCYSFYRYPITIFR